MKEYIAKAVDGKDLTQDVYKRQPMMRQEKKRQRKKQQN